MRGIPLPKLVEPTFRDANLRNQAFVMRISHLVSRPRASHLGALHSFQICFMNRHSPQGRCFLAIYCLEAVLKIYALRLAYFCRPAQGLYTIMGWCIFEGALFQREHRQCEDSLFWDKHEIRCLDLSGSDESELLFEGG